jgi:SAM-dependent methyltransferase
VDEPYDVINLGGFTNVDAGDAAAYIRYLEAGRELREAGKSDSYAFQGLSPGMSVLDVGCGTGEDVRALSALVGSSGSVVGVDASHAMVADAVRRGVPANAAFRAASAYALPFADASFDACRAERVLQHLERPMDALNEMRRILRPGGSAFLIDHDWGTLVITGGDTQIAARVVAAFAESFANGAIGASLESALREAGFRKTSAVTSLTTLPFDLACTFVLHPAIGSATARGVITPAQGEAWIASLEEAERRGTFAYEVRAFAVLGWT